MSRENVEIIRRGYDLWNRGDMDAFLDQYSSVATLDPLPDFADTQIRHGREELRRLFAELREPWDRDEVEADTLVDAGDYVVADHLWRGDMRGTEDEVEMRVGITWSFRDGKIAEMRLYGNFDEALEAAGLSDG
jgi:ketosteroid isomerase-like protein